MGSFEITADQEKCILTAAAEIVAATAQRKPLDLTDPSLAGTAASQVAGVFVSLKRSGRLRSCCGMLGQPIPLVRALSDAALRTTNQDIRFPPISPSELASLELEVWVLLQPERVTARGADRESAVEVGKHGLQIIRGEDRGLLLPGVAVENGWDSRTFLEQTCVKAGVHPSSWKDDQTTLLTFEGLSFADRLASVCSGLEDLPPAQWTRQHATDYAAFARQNLMSLLQGITPSYYFMDAPDGNVNGVTLTVVPPGDDAVHLCQWKLRPDLPLQSTLFSLVQNAAQQLARLRINLGQLQEIPLGVSILSDAAMHGTVADPDLGDVNGSRALLAIEGRRSCMTYDPAQSSQANLDRASDQAEVRRPDVASVYSFDAASNLDRFTIPIVPKAVRGPETRQPAVAGRFYPQEPAELSEMIGGMIPAGVEKLRRKGVMVPHAGLVYSGKIAADVFARTEIPPLVIIIGPKHTAQGVEWAVSPQENWLLPGFEVASSPKAARRMCRSIPGLQLDAAAHHHEHAIEVELPFIHRLAPQSAVLGVAIGRGDWEECVQFAQGLSEFIKTLDQPPLLVISSDMNHFATDQETRRLDELALGALDRLDSRLLYDTVRDNHISMCGVLPAVIVLETLKLLDPPSACERGGYATTADVTGDTSRVVGYAGVFLN